VEDQYRLASHNRPSLTLQDKILMPGRFSSTFEQQLQAVGSIKLESDRSAWERNGSLRPS
jgi:hypothetical protein